VKNLEAAVNPEEPDFNLMRTKAPTLEEVSLQRPKRKEMETRLYEHHDWAGSSPVLLATKGRRMSQSQI
jgi:hypothetical protein